MSWVHLSRRLVVLDGTLLKAWLLSEGRPFSETTSGMTAVILRGPFVPRMFVS